MSIIECSNLTLGYDGVKVLENLNFNVEKGGYLSVVGENGAGKSTLVKAILGLIEPMSGKIIFGEGVGHSEIGYLPQQSEAQRDFPASVYEIVRSGCLGKKGFNPFYTSEDKKRALYYIELLGLEKYKNKSYKALSGGQQQKVLLARALCAAEKLILLDEPVTGLDPVSIGEFYSLVEKLNREGVTVIIVSHDIISAVRYSSHILHITKEGAFYGEVNEYVKSEQYTRIMGGQKDE